MPDEGFPNINNASMITQLVICSIFSNYAQEKTLLFVYL